MKCSFLYILAIYYNSPAEEEEEEEEEEAGLCNATQKRRVLKFDV